MEEGVGEQNHPSLLGYKEDMSYARKLGQKACDIFSEEILEMAEGKVFLSSALKDKTKCEEREGI